MELLGTLVNQHNMGFIALMIGNQMENVTILSFEHSLTVEFTMIQYNILELLIAKFVAAVIFLSHSSVNILQKPGF